jgi:hypothetical protein
VQVRTKDAVIGKADMRTQCSDGIAAGSDAVKTDANGRWQIDTIPDHEKMDLILFVSHPDYISDEFWEEIQKENGITTAMLLQKAATITMRRGVVMRGRVTDPDGKPIKNALIVQGKDPYGANKPGEFPTDADGRYQLPAMKPGKTTLTVIAPSWMPQLREVDLQADLPPQDFRLAPGKTIKMLFVDAAGKPVPRANVMLLEWKGIKSLHNHDHSKVRDTKVPRQANAEGVYEWTWAPDDPVKLFVTAKNYDSHELEIAGGAPPKTITFKAAHRITGSVTDSATGKPIPAFNVIPMNVFRKDWLDADRMHAESGVNGRLDYVATRTDCPQRVRIESLGYRTQTGAEFRVGDDTSRTQNFALMPSEPIRGIILDAAGQPAAKAEVLLAIPTEEIAFRRILAGHKTVTDKAGRFEFPDPDEPFTVMAQTNGGFVLADFTADRRDVGTLRLQPWASVRGQFRDGDRPIAGARIFLRPIRFENLQRPKFDTQQIQVVTDKDGRFEFSRMPPVSSYLWVSIGPWREETFRSGPRVPLDLQPGQQVDLEIGGKGAVVTGKVTLSGKMPADLDCTYSINTLIRREPGIAPPPEIAKLGFEIRGGWQTSWSRTEEVATFLRTLQHWFVKLASDGSFRISGVPAGEYDLALEIYAKPSGCLVDPLARKVVRVTVTAEDAARGELTLPDIPVTIVPVPEVGDTPAFSFHRADGAEGSLADFRGHYTLLHFWASWCGPCKQEFPALKATREKLAARDFVMLGLSLDDDASAWQVALKQHDFPGNKAGLGQSALPGFRACLLIGSSIPPAKSQPRLTRPRNSPRPQTKSN